MSRMNGHVIRLFLDGHNVGNFMTHAAKIERIEANREFPPGTNFVQRVRGVSPDTIYTKAAQA